MRWQQSTLNIFTIKRKHQPSITTWCYPCFLPFSKAGRYHLCQEAFLIAVNCVSSLRSKPQGIPVYFSYILMFCFLFFFLRSWFVKLLSTKWKYLNGRDFVLLTCGWHDAQLQTVSGRQKSIHSGGSFAKSCQTLCYSMDCTCQAPLSMGFSRQEYWSGLPFPSPKLIHRCV